MMVGSPGAAFTWQLWSRVRIIALALGAYLGLLALAVHLPGAMEWRNTLFLAATLLAFGLLFLLGAYALPGKDVLGAESGYPDWMLVLPVRTGELVFWPMMHASLVGVLAWVVPTQLILRPLKVEPPLFWPGVMIAAMFAWLQALLWTPFGTPLLRLLVLLLLLPVMVTAGVGLALEGTSPVLLCAGYAALIPAAFTVAVVGLGAARRGDGPDWGWARLAGVFPRPRLKVTSGFSSGPAAQLWYEWRSSGAALPVATGALCLLATLPFLWVRDLSPIGMMMPRSEFDSVEVNLWLRMQATFLFLPPLLAAVLGCGRRRYDTDRRDLTLHPFLGTRPVPAGVFVGAKLRAAAASTGVTWAILLLFFGGWLLSPGRDGEIQGPALVLLMRYGNVATAGVCAFILAVMVFWTWKNLVQGLFADLSGRRWLVSGAPMLLHTGVLIGFLAWVEWCGHPRDVDLRSVPVPDSWPLLLGLALLAKATLSVAAIRRLVRLGEVSPSRLLLWIPLWSSAVVGLAAGLHWLAHSGRHAGELAAFITEAYLPWCAGAAPDGLKSWGYLVALSALFVPFARLVLAPVSLHWNRHR